MEGMIVNRKARRDYEIKEKITAGVVLEGQEVKSLREGGGSLRNAYAKFMGEELWLVNALIPQYSHSADSDYEPKRKRKLLLKKKELLALRKKMEGKNLVLVPLKLYFEGRWAKVELGLGRGRREYEKKRRKKRKDIEREVERELKRFGGDGGE